MGAKRGRIGHPLPGISVRIADPDTGAPVPLGTPGLLLVRGPNIMKGYLNQPEKTAEVLREGWYVTGDIASQDEDGFLTITDRLSRFSKIGGEMVPHIQVEEHLHNLAGANEQCFAVTGVPDGRKGERLVVLHTLSVEEVKATLERLPEIGLPNLWKPRPNQFFRVDALPYLGTGKLDLRQVRAMALGSLGTRARIIAARSPPQSFSPAIFVISNPSHCPNPALPVQSLRLENARHEHGQSQLAELAVGKKR